ncbi:hypothetical protein V1514DRAFT_335486 [Lipomyces japonicus]|uniref:uncharacterized protein n=1 Tax=Lipomyces japonicus TaxID=56871 RepID=UPI0034CF384F
MFYSMYPIQLYSRKAGIMDYSQALLDKLSNESSVKTNGLILIDGQTGLALDVRGIARQKDAIKLFAISKLSGTLNQDGIGAVEYHDQRIILRQESNCLIGLYTDRTF